MQLLLAKIQDCDMGPIPRATVMATITGTLFA